MKPPYFPQYWKSTGTVPLESLGGHSYFTIVLKSEIGAVTADSTACDACQFDTRSYH